jgi:hypothetical protein
VVCPRNDISMFQVCEVRLSLYRDRAFKGGASRAGSLTEHVGGVWRPVGDGLTQTISAWTNVSERTV